MPELSSDPVAPDNVFWEYPDGRRVPIVCRYVEDEVGDRLPWVHPTTNEPTEAMLSPGYWLVPLPGDDDVKLIMRRPWPRGVRYALQIPNNGWVGDDK